MAGWIKMALGTEVGLGPGHIVVAGDPAPLLQKGAEPPSSFRPMPIVAKRLNGSRCHWYGGRPRPRRHCVRWGSSSPPPKKKVRGHSPQFSANVRCSQTAEWTKMPLGMELFLGPGDSVFHGHPAPPEKKGTASTQFWPMSIVAKRLDG